MIEAPLWISSRRQSAGSAMIGLLLVVLIIMILVTRGYLQKDPVTQVSEGKGYIDRSKGTACTLNRQAMATEITRMTMSANGEVPSIHVLKAKLGGTRCPEGGVYQTDPKGTLYCTKHAPAPPEADAKNLYD